MPTLRISESFAILGLDQGCSLDTVKTKYKQIALRTHPDKNPDNPDATAEFQRVSEAYDVIIKHLDPSAKHPSGRGHPFGFSTGSDSNDEDDFDEDEYYDVNMPFYLWLFERMMGGGSIYVAGRGSSRAHFRRPVKKESQAEYQERLRRLREEQLAAQDRRKRESIARKERQAWEREQERLAAESRQKEKAQQKKARVDAERRSSEERARALMRKAQENRSAVFTAARKGDAEGVKKGIWENAVDAAGGEIKPGCVDFLSTCPEDPKETLLHIAVTNGDLNLIRWLDSHSADPEERNAEGMTALHLALKLGRIPVVSYFFDAYPPRDSECSAVYDCSDCSDLLSLALESREPELVWMVLENALATPSQMANAWKWVSTASGLLTLRGHGASAQELEKADDILKLLMRYGGFSSSKGIKSDIRADTHSPNADPETVRPEQPRSVKSSRNNIRTKDNNRGQSTRPKR